MNTGSGASSKINSTKKSNYSMLNVTKFKLKHKKTSNIYNDSMLEVSNNTLIPKLLMVPKIPRYYFFGFSKILRFRF